MDGWMGWDGMGWDGMGWDGMGWDGMGWDGMGWDGMGWDGMGWDGMGWDGMGWDGMGWDGMGWDGMGWDGMGWDGWMDVWMDGWMDACGVQHASFCVFKGVVSAATEKGSFPTFSTMCWRSSLLTSGKSSARNWPAPCTKAWQQLSRDLLVVYKMLLWKPCWFHRRYTNHIAPTIPSSLLQRSPPHFHFATNTKGYLHNWSIAL